MAKNTIFHMSGTGPSLNIALNCWCPSTNLVTMICRAWALTPEVVLGHRVGHGHLSEQAFLSSKQTNEQIISLGTEVCEQSPFQCLGMGTKSEWGYVL